jgi:hypothetical protein
MIHELAVGEIFSNVNCLLMCPKAHRLLDIASVTIGFSHCMVSGHHFKHMPWFKDRKGIM